MPIVEVQAYRGDCAGRVVDSSAGVADIPRPGVGAKHLKAVREALVGAQQQPLVVLIAGRFEEADRTGGAERPRVTLLGGCALGNHRAADAVEMVQVDAVDAHAPMDEMPQDEVGAEDEIAGDLALKAQVEMLRGPTRNGGGIQEGSRYLFYDLDRLQRRIGIGEVACQAGPDGGKNRHHVGSG